MLGISPKNDRILGHGLIKKRSMYNFVSSCDVKKNIEIECWDFFGDFIVGFVGLDSLAYIGVRMNKKKRLVTN